MNEIVGIIIQGVSSIYRHDLAVFAIGTSTLSLILCLLDWVSSKLFNTASLLKVGYGGMRTLQSFFFWGFGAGLAAYVGGLAGLFNIQSINSNIIVGVGWPTILPRLIEMAAKEEELEQDEQISEEEQDET